MALFVILKYNLKKLFVLVFLYLGDFYFTCRVVLSNKTKNIPLFDHYADINKKN